jgi:probable F420-dependent oxidoreductase
MKLGVSLPVREMKDDLGAIRAYAELAEDLGFSHLRVPDLIIGPSSGHLHEPMMLLAWIAAFTSKIELCPSVIVLPARQTAHFAKQVAELDVLSGGRARIGIGVGAGKEQYEALGQDFHTRGARCDEQLELLNGLLTQESVEFEGRWDRVQNMGLDPLPVQSRIPIWYGGASVPSDPVVRRIGRFCDGWFVLCSPEDFAGVKGRIDGAAMAAGRSPSEINTEAGVAVVGPREAEWQDRISNWRTMGLDYVCVRTLGGALTADQHLDRLREVAAEAFELSGEGT